VLPLPSRSHPQKQNRAVYTKELTHLFWRSAKLYSAFVFIEFQGSQRPFSERAFTNDNVLISTRISLGFVSHVRQSAKPILQ
jgi:hypothetical protein